MLNLTEGQHFDHKYELVRLIDSGGFAEVWEARYLEAGNVVAMKIYPRLDEEGAATIEAEYKRLFELQHSNLVNALHFGRFRHYPYLVMRYYPGGNASRRIGRCDEGEVATILAQVGGCLKYLHANDIVHQDIKPNNFLLDQKGNYYLADLGLSLKVRTTIQLRTMRDPQAGDPAHRRAAVTGITPPPYRAPELTSPHSIDRMPIKATDVWALGASVYELIAGFPPFGDLGGLMQKQGAVPPALPGGYSKELEGLLARCLDMDPGQRPAAAVLEKWGLRYLETTQAPSAPTDAGPAPATPPVPPVPPEPASLPAQTIRPSLVAAHIPPPPVPPDRVNAPGAAPRPAPPRPAKAGNLRLVLILGAVAVALAFLVVVILNSHTGVTIENANQPDAADTLTETQPDSNAVRTAAPVSPAMDSAKRDTVAQGESTPVNDDKAAGGTGTDQQTPGQAADPGLKASDNLDLAYPTVDFPPRTSCPLRISRIVRSSNSLVVYIDFSSCPGDAISLYGPGDDRALYATNAAHTQVYYLTYLSVSGEHIQIPADGLRVVAAFQRPPDDVDVLDIIEGTDRTGASDAYFDFKGIHL